jgi:serine/threonine-protein kinase
MAKIGRYEIISEIGKGGMGVVYRAFDPFFQRELAIKTVSAELSADQNFRDRFFREARSAGRLNHSNIITVHDLGEDNGRPFMAMEYLEGRDLAAEIREGRQIALERKLEIIRDVCRGLSHAHQKEVVHRDIKPGNVFVTSFGLVKILDFGLARSVSDDTTSTKLMGTPNYMSPEQWTMHADQRSDIFAVGAVLYELLTYRKAFEAESYQQVMYKILNEEPQPVGTVRPELPAQVEAIVTKALAKDPANRYQNIGDMARELENSRVSLEEQKRVLAKEVREAVTRLGVLIRENREILQERSAAAEELVRRVAPSLLEGPGDQAGIRDGATWVPQQDFVSLWNARENANQDFDLLKALSEKLKGLAPLVSEAMSLERSGNLESAAELLRAVVVEDPDNTLASRLYHDVMSRMEQDRLAREARQKADELMIQAASLLEGNDLAGCRHALNQVLALQPEDPRAAEMLQQVDAALSAMREAEEKKAQSQIALEAARRWLAQEDFKKARKEVERAVKLWPDADPEGALRAEISRAESEFRARRKRESRICSLLEEAQLLDKQGLEDEALARVAELLELEPSNRPAAEIRAGIESRRTIRSQVKSLLDKAQVRFGVGDLRGTTKLLEDVLQLDPDNPDALNLRSQVQQKLTEQAELREKRRQAAHALAAARKALLAEEVDDARREVARAQTIYPETPRIAELLVEIDRVADRIARRQEQAHSIARNLREARNLFEAGVEERALARLNELFAAAPDHLGAIRLKREIEEKRQTRERAEALHQKAQAKFQAGDFHACLSLLDEVRSLQPQHLGAITLRDDAIEKVRGLSQEERRRLAEEALAEAQKALSLDGLDRVRSEISWARTFSPDASEIRDQIEEVDRSTLALSARRERDQRVKRLLDEAASLAEVGEYESALGRLQELLSLDRTNVAGIRLRKEIEGKRESAEKAESMFRQATSRFLSNEFAACQEMLEEVLRLEPNHAAAKALREGVREKIRQQAEFDEKSRQAKGWIAEAEKSLAARDFAAARESLRKARALCPDLGEVIAFERTLQRIEEDQRTAEEQQKRVRDLYEAAAALADSGDDEDALARLSQALEIDPEHLASRRLKKRLEAQIDVRKRVEGAVHEARAAFEKGEVKRCLTHLQEALSIDPAHDAALRLRKSAEADLEQRTRRSDEVLASARKALLAENFDLARQEVENARAIFPESTQVSETKLAVEKAEAGQLARKERERQIVRWFEEASVLDRDGEEEMAWSLVEKVLGLEPAHFAARKLRKEIELRRQERERAAAAQRARLDEILQKALEAEAASNLGIAAEHARAVLAEDPNHTKARELLGRVETDFKKREAMLKSSQMAVGSSVPGLEVGYAGEWDARGPVAVPRPAPSEQEEGEKAAGEILAALLYLRSHKIVAFATLALAVLAIAAGTFALLYKPPLHFVKIDASPWARVTIRSASGDVVAAKLETPVVVQLRSGEYILEYEPETGERQSRRVAVPRDSSAVVRVGFWDEKRTSELVDSVK